ncbi:hypothetical protein AGMMS49941_07390 [Deferribacterales bacterium]|nr:hypothetical protein AGMMS49941_07390 [Deferribacterales bacterium]
MCSIKPKVSQTFFDITLLQPLFYHNLKKSEKNAKKVLHIVEMWCIKASSCLFYNFIYKDELQGGCHDEYGTDGSNCTTAPVITPDDAYTYTTNGANV